MSKRIFKIAVCGASKGELTEYGLEKAKELGRLIAQHHHYLLTGACTGYPEMAAIGAKENNGQSIGFSVGNNWEENEKQYPNLNQDLYDIVIYTGLGEGRNFVLVKSADICIFMGKGTGTLMELTIALKYGKKIGVLEKIGGIDEIIDKVTDLSWDQYPEIKKSDDPEKLINELISS
jgi:uncharacterized protein (TIGR00725 family)